MASKVTSKIEINKQFSKELESICNLCLGMTAEATMTEIDNMDIIPKLSGDLEALYTKPNLDNIDKGEAFIESSGPYARYIYYNRQNKNISQVKNNNAQDHYFQPFIDGSRKSFIEDTFKTFLNKKIQ